jgi:hypothetical protein
MATEKTPFVVKKIKQVTMAVHKVPKDQEKYFLIQGPIHAGKQIDDNKPPAQLCEAIDLETGELGLLITPTVLKNELLSQYPGDAYVGKCFSLVMSMSKTKAGQPVNIPAICEIADPREYAETTAKSEKGLKAA